MKNSRNTFQLKTMFRNVNYYSMPISILFIFRKRLNLILNVVLLIFFFFLILI